jgi:hypothetical protein
MLSNASAILVALLAITISASPTDDQPCGQEHPACPPSSRCIYRPQALYGVCKLDFELSLSQVLGPQLLKPLQPQPHPQPTHQSCGQDYPPCPTPSYYCKYPLGVFSTDANAQGFCQRFIIESSRPRQNGPTETPRPRPFEPFRLKPQPPPTYQSCGKDLPPCPLSHQCRYPPIDPPPSRPSGVQLPIAQPLVNGVCKLKPELPPPKYKSCGWLSPSGIDTSCPAPQVCIDHPGVKCGMACDLAGICVE